MSISLIVSDLLELCVVLFQVTGVVSLGVSRLVPYKRFANLGRIAFIFALIGLGLTGAFLGNHDSEFALFAGGTLTMLLVGMTVGGQAATETLEPAVADARRPGCVA